jgi:hypothetical protein
MRVLENIWQTLKDLFRFLWKRRLWWLIPMIVVLLLIGILVILGSTYGLVPWMYPIF